MAYKFILQKITGEIAHDFVLGAKNAVEFANWFEDRNDYCVKYVECINELIRTEVTDKTIPVGTVEFVGEFYKIFHNISHIPPISLQGGLLKYADREIKYGDETQVREKTVFCKSIDKVKGFTDIIDKNYKLEPGKYMFSELVEIESEWRCFIHNEELLGVHNYSNSLSHYPNIKTIKKIINIMINDYEDLKSYTLDVGVNDNGTFVIEVHDFYSCGLYGFINHSKIIQMLIQSHNYKIKEYKGI